MMHQIKRELKVYTAKDIQRILSCSSSTAYKLMNERIFPTFKIGKRMYVLPEEFEKFLKQSRGKTIIL